MSDAIIKMTGGVIRQQDNTILKNVNIEIRKGEFVYLIGKVGSGKSSFLKTLYAELPLTYGTAEVAGFRLKKIRKSQIPMLRRKCGIVFQDFKLLIDRNVYANLEFVLRATGWKSKKAIKERIETVLANVGMVDKQMQMPHQLSGGEQQRIVLARALLNAPPLILADEPTGNIDPETSYRLVELLKEISDTGKTVIIATHQYDLIEKFPGRVLCCENGELTEKTPAISYERTELPRIQAPERVVEAPTPVPADSRQDDLTSEYPAVEAPAPVSAADSEPKEETVPVEAPQEAPSAVQEEIIPEPQPETPSAVQETPVSEARTETPEQPAVTEQATATEESDEDILALIGKLDYPEIFAFDYELEQLPEIDSEEPAVSQEETATVPESEETTEKTNPETEIDPEAIPASPVKPETEEQETTTEVEKTETETAETADEEQQHANTPENISVIVQQAPLDEEKPRKNMPPAMDLELID